VTLSSGTHLGPYEIIAHVGAGGMGEVYRAKDTRLNRVVAVKVLPTHLCGNAEFKQRFEREAQTISSLSHANICQLFDVGCQNGTDFLVMEFLDGETLAERLRKGPLQLQELLKIGVEVAAALATAHRAAIVHRDLKPGNIMLTKSGAKLMDFGLARSAALGASASGSAPLLSATKTISGPSPVSPLTSAGTIVGTIQYMSPEQIEGKEVDARSDVFAFGAVLYEMATGKRAFEGKSQISVASAILEKDPEPVSEVSPLAPPALDYLIATCLAKDREDRLQSAHDVLLQLKGIAHNSRAVATAAGNHFSRMLSPILILAAAGVLLAAATVLFFVGHRARVSMLPVRAYIPPPAGTSFRASGFDAGPVVISPDGTTLAFAAVDEKGRTNLWLRPLNAQQATILPGTEDGATPFWSPDGQYLGFIANGKLKKINVTGGQPQTIAEGASSRRSGCAEWNIDDTILFCKQIFGPMYRVAAAGGDAAQATRLGSDEISNNSAAFLPDGKHFLYAARYLNRGAQIMAGVLGKPDQSGAPITAGDSPRYVSGYLLFVHDGHILAQPFNPASLKLSGDPQTLGEARDFSVSQNGLLVYHESSGESELKVLDRNGNVLGTPGPLAAYQTPRFSPDGRSIAVTVRDRSSGNEDIWVYPVAGGRPTRVTFGPENYWAVWSPDGRELAYTASENGVNSIRRRSLDGLKPEEILYKNPAYKDSVALDWSADGKYLSLDVMAKDGAYVNWALPLQNREAFRPAATANLSVSEYDGIFSKDGRWLAYFSYESGRPEVYVVPFLSDGAKYQVSTTGGWDTRFAGKNEVFYLTMGNRLMVAAIDSQSNFHIGTPRPLVQLDLPNFASPHYDVSADGQRFAVLTTDHTKSSSITLVMDWSAPLKK